MIRRLLPSWEAAAESLTLALLVLIAVGVWQVDRKLDRLDAPDDVYASEIEELRHRLTALERKAERAKRSQKRQKEPTGAGTAAESPVSPHK